LVFEIGLFLRLPGARSILFRGAVAIFDGIVICVNADSIFIVAKVMLVSSKSGVKGVLANVKKHFVDDSAQEVAAGKLIEIMALLEEDEGFNQALAFQ
jgi:hypothetical protein